MAYWGHLKNHSGECRILQKDPTLFMGVHPYRAWKHQKPEEIEIN